MSKLEDKVNEILGINEPEPKKEIVKQEFKPAVPRRDDDSKADVDNDYKYSRENYYNLIERGQEAIEGILDIAREGQHPRAYEVAGQLIGQVAGTVDKLQDLQKKLKDLKQATKGADTKIQNALFVGSTAELQKTKKIILEISNLQYIKSMTPLQELLDGEELENPIEVLKHHISTTPRYGAGGVPYKEKEFSVWRGSQRVQAALKLGYTHIEGIIINE